MHVEGYVDAQLISASFDLHGSISRELVETLDLRTAYRAAPHTDQTQTRVRAVQLLLDAILEDQRPIISHIGIPILISGEKGVTSVEPLRSLYYSLPTLVDTYPWLLDASIFVGMPWTDIPRAGMSVQIVASDERYRSVAMEEAQKLANEIWTRRKELAFDVDVSNSIDEAIQTALQATEHSVFLTDSGDNPLFLERLVELGVDSAVVAGIADPDAVEVCIQAGIGAEVELSLGGKIDTIHVRSFHCSGTVIFVSNPISNSQKRPVVVDVCGVRVVILNDRRSFIHVSDFTEVGIDPLCFKIVVVKLGYLVQELRDIALRTIMTLTRGFTDQAIEELEYENVRRPVYPLDEEMAWNAAAVVTSDD